MRFASPACGQRDYLLVNGQWQDHVITALTNHRWKQGKPDGVDGTIKLDCGQMDEKTLDVAEYVEQMALLLDLQLKPEHRPGVVENFGRIRAIAQLVNEFPLPAEIEAYPVFEP